MAKAKTIFYCTACGNETPKWQGRCPACGAWNTMVEHTEKPLPAGRVSAAPVGTSRQPKHLSQVTSSDEIRFSTGMSELDRVLGGGAVESSLVLVGGAPGIGKSTLLLQICACLCKERKVLYVSGEESERQLKLRAERLKVASENLLVLSETRITDILEAVQEVQPDILIAVSIQTLYNDANESSPGSVSQVKDCTMILMQLAKGHGLTIFVVGHINKDGAIAGPKVLEHLKAGFGDKRLNFRKHWTGSLHGAGHAGTGGVFGATSQKHFRRVWYLHQPPVAHFKHPDFVGGAEAVFGGAKQAIGSVSVSFKVQNAVYHML